MNLRAPNARYVKPTGDPQAKIALVGEAPGQRENEIGLPFVGPSGDLLTRMMNEAGLIRSQCWLTNLVKYRPPNNEIGCYFKDRQKKIPKPEMVECCEELRKELLEIKPNVVVAIGGTAMWALTGEPKGITKWRGSVLESTLIPGLKVIPTIHPASILRNYVPDRQTVPVDLRRAAKEMEFPEIRRPQRTYIVDASHIDTMKELDRLDAEAEYLSFDIETVNPLITCIGFSDNPSRAISVPFTRGIKPYWTLDEQTALWKRICALLENPRIKKIAQNAQYDILYLARFIGIHVQNLWMDTMIAHHEVYPELPRGLDYLASIYTDEPYYKEEGKEAEKKRNDMERWIYNCKDAAVTLECAFAIDTELREAGLWDAYRETMRYVEPLMTMTLQGVRFDKERRDVLHRDYIEKANQLQDELDRAIGKPLNVNSNKQMTAFLYGELGLPIRRKTQESGPTADDAALRHFRQKYPKYENVFTVMMAIRRLRKMANTFIDVVPDPFDQRIRSSYDVSGTTTWRLSSKQSIWGGGCNLQNQPKRPLDTDMGMDPLAIRNLYVADEGKFMFASDLSQAEARVVDWLSEDEQQIRRYLARQDTHVAYASRLFKIPFEELCAMEEGTEEERKRFKHMRRLGKTVRHATNYGMGPKKLQEQAMKEGLILEYSECKTLLQAAASASPMLEHWHRRVREKIERDRTLTTFFGKKRRFGERWGDELYRQAYAFEPQSTVGQLCNRGLRRVYDELCGQGVDLLLQIHDEVVGQCPMHKPELAWQAMLLMQEEIEIRGRPLTIPTELKVGFKWGSLKGVNSVEDIEPTLAGILSTVHE